jgi:hypothetical protein
MHNAVCITPLNQILSNVGYHEFDGFDVVDNNMLLVNVHCWRGDQGFVLGCVGGGIRCFLRPALPQPDPQARRIEGSLPIVEGRVDIVEEVPNWCMSARLCSA